MNERKLPRKHLGEYTYLSRFKLIHTTRAYQRLVRLRELALAARGRIKQPRKNTRKPLLRLSVLHRRLANEAGKKVE